jgi:hypothetical protein
MSEREGEYDDVRERESTMMLEREGGYDDVRKRGRVRCCKREGGGREGMMMSEREMDDVRKKEKEVMSEREKDTVRERERVRMPEREESTLCATMSKPVPSSFFPSAPPFRITKPALGWE